MGPVPEPIALQRPRAQGSHIGPPGRDGRVRFDRRITPNDHVRRRRSDASDRKPAMPCQRMRARHVHADRPASARAPRIVRSSNDTTHGRDTGSSTPMTMRMRVRIAPPLRSGSQAFAGSLASSAPSAWPDTGNVRRGPTGRLPIGHPTMACPHTCRERTAPPDGPAPTGSDIRRHGRTHRPDPRLPMPARWRDRPNFSAKTNRMRTPARKPTIRRPMRGHADIGTVSRFGREKNADGGKAHGGGMRRTGLHASISGTKRSRGP